MLRPSTISIKKITHSQNQMSRSMKVVRKKVQLLELANGAPRVLWKVSLVISRSAQFFG